MQSTLIPAGIGPLVQSAGTTLQTDQSGADWLGGTWWQQLQPGSWRGVGFVMDAAETKAGRRTAQHEYPYRDTIWVEDLGRLPRRFSFQAFLVGDDVYQQRNAMIQACEQPGEGTLVHPTLGSVQCVLVEFSTTDRRERGRMVEIAFSFVVSGDLTFPQSAEATGDQVNSLSSALQTAAAGDLGSNLGALTTLPQYAMGAVSQFAGVAINTVNDATRFLNSVNGLQGFYGRYSMGRMSSLLPATATVQSALGAAVSTRNAVISAANNLSALAGSI